MTNGNSLYKFSYSYLNDVKSCSEELITLNNSYEKTLLDKENKTYAINYLKP